VRFGDRPRPETSAPVGPLEHLEDLLFRRVDVASLVFFRVAFGLVLLWEVKRYLGRGWIARYWIEPRYNFPYEFFEWVRPWPGDGMYVHFYVMAVLALFITIGFLYRLSAALFFVAFVYMFLLEQARYLNHFYLVALVSFLLIFVPAHHACSVDARIWPGLRRRAVPAWPVVLLAGQIGLVYFFGAVAKMNPDWLRGEPIRSWLAERTDFPVIGAWFTEGWMVYLFAYSGLLLDLLAVPFLVWRRTRPFMFALLLLFHYTNDRLFSIGIFPWFAIAATTLFFAPDWPRRLIGGLRERLDRRATLAWAGALAMAAIAIRYRDELELVPVSVGATAGALLGWTLASPPQEPAAPMPPGAATYRRQPLDTTSHDAAAVPLGRGRWTVAFVCVWFAIQVAIPLRHFAIPGNASWTEEGRNFSWHMKLRSKSGDVRFSVVDRTDGSSRIVDPRDYLEDWQYDEMSGSPQMIRLFARHLAAEIAKNGSPAVEVRAAANISLNGRQPQPLIDPDIDLSREPFSFGPALWILPLTEPLRRQ
jgi:hypothetical protein